MSLSTTEAEYLVGTEAVNKAIWIQPFLKAIGIQQQMTLPIRLFGDNQSANALVWNPEYHICTKHIQGKQSYTSEIVEQELIEVATEDMVTDTLYQRVYKKGGLTEDPPSWGSLLFVVFACGLLYTWILKFEPYIQTMAGNLSGSLIT